MKPELPAIPMRRPASDEDPPLSPNEKATGLLVLVAICATTWMLAGRADAAPYIYFPLCGLSVVVSCWLARRERFPINYRGFLPLLLLGSVTAASLLNISFMPLPENPSVLITRPGWIAWLPGTIDRSETLRAAVPWISALMLAGAIRQANFGPRAVRLLWAALLIHGLVVSGVGAYFFFTDPNSILGLFRDPYGYHFASFVYRNHWAAYVVLLVAVALGFSFSALRHWSRRRIGLDAILPGLVVALLLAITLPMPGTRSGMVMVALLFSSAAFFLLRRIARINDMPISRRWSLLLLIAGFLASVGFVGVSLNRQTLQKHWNRTVQEAQGLTQGAASIRMNFTKDTLRIAWERPVWGWGLGSFARVFRSYHGDYLRDEYGRPKARLLRAHNDWAQIWAEAGIVGLMVLVVPVIMRLRDICSDGRPLFRWAAFGLILLLLYGWVDFPFHNPAVLFLWVAILCSASPRTDSEYAG